MKSLGLLKFRLLILPHTVKYSRLKVFSYKREEIEDKGGQHRHCYEKLLCEKPYCLLILPLAMAINDISHATDRSKRSVHK